MHACRVRVGGRVRVCGACVSGEGGGAGEGGTSALFILLLLVLQQKRL